MENLNFDSGIREYKINNNGVLRFNPGDPNVYARFFEATEKLREIEKEMETKSRALNQNDGTGVLRLLAEADKHMKDALSWVFGEGNNFDDLLGGVNVLAVADNGERVITNLINALAPILQEGAEKCAKNLSESAVNQAKQNRALRQGKCN